MTKTRKPRTPYIPGKRCAQCGEPLKRDMNYARRKYCSKACMGRSYRATPDRFWEKVDKTSHPGGCWLYMGFRKWDGYGWLSRMVDGKPKYMTAHRCAWILTQGFPPEGMHVLHKCDNPPCCNPLHLRLGTHQENMTDCKEKGRHNNGHKPVLHPDRVRPRKATNVA